MDQACTAGVATKRELDRTLACTGKLVEAEPEFEAMEAVAGAGVLLVFLLWGSTFFWQVPAHQRLSESFDPATHRRLVQSNWLRTVGWTGRGLLICWINWQAMSS